MNSTMQNSKGEDPYGDWGILQIYLGFIFCASDPVLFSFVNKLHNLTMQTVGPRDFTRSAFSLYIFFPSQRTTQKGVEGSRDRGINNYCLAETESKPCNSHRLKG